MLPRIDNCLPIKSRGPTKKLHIKRTVSLFVPHITKKRKNEQKKLFKMQIPKAIFAIFYL